MSEIQQFSGEQNVDITAVCDVWNVNLKKAADRVKQWFGAKPRTTTRFGELLALDDVDAVVIATPDFAHTPILIEALKAGKDVYVEKPMSMEITPAHEALHLARANSRVVQVGTQRRSDGKFETARRAIADGKLGRISRVSAAVCFNHPRWLRPFEDCKKKDVDWDAYLFNREKRPFDPKQIRRWNLYRDFSSGLSGLWMSHFADIVNKMTGATYPRTATANGGTYVWKDGREHCDTFCALLDYPEEYLFDWTMTLANGADNHFRIFGTEATLNVDRMEFTTAGGDGEGKGPRAKLEIDTPDEHHMANWLKCLRTREKPIADIVHGVEHSVAAMMAATALHTGQRQRYDTSTHTASVG